MGGRNAVDSVAKKPFLVSCSILKDESKGLTSATSGAGVIAPSIYVWASVVLEIDLVFNAVEIELNKLIQVK
jgi:hypothetical protein